MSGSEAEDVYGSGLNLDDWNALREVLYPFLHTKDPFSIKIPPFADHLSNHPLIEFVRLYRRTAKEEYLDKAGQCLIPSEEPFAGTCR